MWSDGEVPAAGKAEVPAASEAGVPGKVEGVSAAGLSSKGAKPKALLRGVAGLRL